MKQQLKEVKTIEDVKRPEDFYELLAKKLMPYVKKDATKDNLEEVRDVVQTLVDRAHSAGLLSTSLRAHTYFVKRNIGIDDKKIDAGFTISVELFDGVTKVTQLDEYFVFETRRSEVIEIVVDDPVETLDALFARKGDEDVN